MEEFNSADILEKQNRKKRFAILEVGLFEISFVLIIIIVLFGLLNYFNILSLSKLYPNTFGFLPHQQTTPISSLANQTQIQEYTNHVKQKGLAKPFLIDTKTQTWEAYGLYAGYQNNAVKIVTVDGILELKLLPNSIFQTMTLITNPNTKQIDSFKASPKYDQATFKKSAVLGSLVQAHYIKGGGLGMGTTSISYYPNLK